MSQIKNLPARYPELGRIRLGEKVKTKNGKDAPKKGEFLRFTSNDQLVLKAISSQLGGDVEPWEGGEQTWQLTSESAEVEVFLPPDPIDTSYERWGSGGVQKRCDGERCLRPVKDGDGGYLEEVDCLCLAEQLVPGDREDMKKGACQVTVRLRLVLPQVPGIGVWMCTSHSVYAAMELPGQVELLRAITFASGGAGLIPAVFAIEKRTEKKPWEKYERDFIVPVLRVRASLAQLAAGDFARPAEIAAPVRALPAASEQVSPVGDAERLRQSVLGPAPREQVSGETSGGVSPGAAADEWDRTSIEQRIGELDADMKTELSEARKTAGLPSVKDPMLTAEQAHQYLDLIDRVRELVFDRRRKHVMVVLGEVGVTSAEARHAVIRQVTNGEVESSKRLSAAQVAGVVDFCAALKAEDEGVSA